MFHHVSNAANRQLAFCICDERIINSWVFPPTLTPQAGDKGATGSPVASCYSLCHGRAETKTSWATAPAMVGTPKATQSGLQCGRGQWLWPPAWYWSLDGGS